MTTTPHPLPLAVTVLVTALFVALGELTRRRLATGDYRIDDDEVSGPPGPGWWCPPLLGVLALVVCVRVGDLAHWAAVPAYLFLAWMTVVVVWVDLDVHRIPQGLLRPAWPAVVVLLGVAQLADGGRHWRGALVGMVGYALLYFAWSWLPGGGIGWGDVRLSPILGLYLGWLGVGHLVVGVLATFLLGGFFGVATLVRHGFKRGLDTAYGPAMALGAFVAILASSQIMSTATGG